MELVQLCSTANTDPDHLASIQQLLQNQEFPVPILTVAANYVLANDNNEIMSLLIPYFGSRPHARFVFVNACVMGCELTVKTFVLFGMHDRQGIDKALDYQGLSSTIRSVLNNLITTDNYVVSDPDPDDNDDYASIWTTV